jgi:hypothetical protein
VSQTEMRNSGRRRKDHCQWQEGIDTGEHSEKQVGQLGGPGDEIEHGQLSVGRDFGRQRVESEQQRACLRWRHRETLGGAICGAIRSRCNASIRLLEVFREMWATATLSARTANRGAKIGMRMQPGTFPSVPAGNFGGLPSIQSRAKALP